MKAKEFIEEKMKRAERFLFNFSIAYFYTFIAGILVSLAVNVYRVYGIALSLFMSSIAAFGISVLLGKARSEWEAAGLPQDLTVIRRDYIESGKRIKLMRLSFAIIFAGTILSIFLISPIYSMIVNYLLHLIT